MGYIYKITNLINQKCYIGETIQNDINKRWNKHISTIKLKEGCPVLKKAMIKHGIDNFKFQILIICFDDCVLKQEENYIKKYNSLIPNGYNVLKSGEKGMTGYKHTPETKEKMRQKTIEFMKNNPDHYETYREKHKESLNKLDLSSLTKNSEKFKKALEEGRVGGCKEETKNKISESVKNYYNKIDINTKKNNLEKLKEVIEKKLGKPIAQYDLDGNLIKEYPSISDAGIKSTVKKANILHVLTGKNNTAGGYIWKYVDKEEFYKK